MSKSGVVPDSTNYGEASKSPEYGRSGSGVIPDSTIYGEASKSPDDGRSGSGVVPDSTTSTIVPQNIDSAQQDNGVASSSLKTPTTPSRKTVGSQHGIRVISGVIPHSTPVRKTSAQHNSQTSPAADAGVIHQSRLVRILQAELNMHVWENSPDEVASMLSPKTYSKDGTVCLIENEYVNAMIDALVENSFAWMSEAGWPKGDGEKSFYSPLTNVLNGCVKMCNDIYDSLRKDSVVHEALKASGFALGSPEERYFLDLVFDVYDRTVGDSLYEADPLKPDILAFAKRWTREVEFKAFWSLVEGKADAESRRKIEFPIEVKDNWTQLVRQIATYVRAQWAASPLRCFVPAIGFSHKSGTVSFLIFHRGGLTMSEPQKIINVRKRVRTTDRKYKLVLEDTPKKITSGKSEKFRETYA